MDSQKCDLCRLCLGSINGCDEILLNNNQHLTKAIFLITGIEVVSDSGQCEYLCNQCKLLLEQCVEFRKTCISNDGIFRGMMTVSEHNEDYKPELENPVAEYIKQEPVDLEEPADDVNKGLENYHIVPAEDVIEASESVHILPAVKINKSLENIYTCDECGKSYSRRNSLYQHYVALHSGEKRYACTICGDKFSRAAQRLYHERTAHSKAPPLDCDRCDRSFKIKSDLMLHIRHHDEIKSREFLELLAERETKSKQKNDFSTELSKPKRIFRKVQCQQCGIMVVDFYLKEHLEIHNSNRQKLCCPHCPKEYAHTKDLKRHINGTHTNETQYPCDRCGKSYISQYSLNEHYIAMHSGEKRYECTECGEKFARASMRSYHRRMAHSTFRPFACEYCDKPFLTRSELIKHQVLHIKHNKQPTAGKTTAL